MVKKYFGTTGAKYHSAFRKVSKKEANIVNCHFASALSKNRTHDFWYEAKRIWNSKRDVSSIVDDCCNAEGVANLFSTKYQEFTLVFRMIIVKWWRFVILLVIQ